ncbi:hypothetical protein K2173_005047 [Erythroxylum novogranatense]|uniref:glucan endo-1,3-beta-D-glucosidase n=1 Tax=Erythroxylum novogranatense TaxID=1862640 RepID=A0AAV8TBA3_9ROSI|nr:hypothetical protein K2173_005047 [Erythroxylum novogranatense]
MNVLFCFIALNFLFYSNVASLPVIGVTYNAPPHPSQSADRIASAISALRLHSVRLPNPDPKLIRSFSFSNTSLLLSIPNILLPPLAANRSLALRWLYGHLLPFYPRSKISLISVGNDAVTHLSQFLVPAIRNVHLALRDLGIKKVSVSTTFSFPTLVTTPFPPSSATFCEPLDELVITPLLQFLEETNSSFLVNLYPYDLYRINSQIPLVFALFQDHPFNFRDDWVTGVRYRNLFDMMLDAVITSLAVAGHENIPVIVTETGWPSSGEVDATPVLAEMYIKGLISHLKSGLGTPLRKEGAQEVYIYELVDKEEEEEKQHGVPKWGILHANMSTKYKIDFSSSSKIGASIEILVGIWLALIGLLFHQLSSFLLENKL